MRVSLFATCLGDRFFARAAADAVRLLRSLGVDVHVPLDQTCCGQPAWNAGHPDPARRMAEHTRAVFAGGDPVILPSGSCTAMVRCVYPELLEGPRAPDDGPRSTRSTAGPPSGARGPAPAPAPGPGPAPGPWLESSPLHARVRELAEFIVEDLRVTELGRGLEGRRLAYHHGCHALRELGQREAPLALLRAAGAELVPWEAAEECCGFGGLFAVKVAPVSVAMADRKLDTLPAVDAVVSADPGCLLHMGSRGERRGTVGSSEAAVLRFVPLATALWQARSGGGSRGRP